MRGLPGCISKSPCCPLAMIASTWGKGKGRRGKGGKGKEEREKEDGEKEERGKGGKGKGEKWCKGGKGRGWRINWYVRDLKTG